jgi:hypothetical protein
MSVAIVYLASHIYQFQSSLVSQCKRQTLEPAGQSNTSKVTVQPSTFTTCTTPLEYTRVYMCSASSCPSHHHTYNGSSMAQLLPAYAQLLLIRLLIATLLLAKIVVGQSPGPPSVITCSVLLQGNGTAGSEKGSIRCSGGSIKAAADDPAVLRTLQRNSRGVAWQDDNCGMDSGSCMLVVCGINSTSTEPMQVKLTVKGVADMTQQRWAAVCIVGDTKAVLQVGHPPLTVQGLLRLDFQASRNTSPSPPSTLVRQPPPDQVHSHENCMLPTSAVGKQLHMHQLAFEQAPDGDFGWGSAWHNN